MSGTFFLPTPPSVIHVSWHSLANEFTRTFGDPLFSIHSLLLTDLIFSSLHRVSPQNRACYFLRKTLSDGKGGDVLINLYDYFLGRSRFSLSLPVRYLLLPTSLGADKPPVAIPSLFSLTALLVPPAWFEARRLRGFLYPSPGGRCLSSIQKPQCPLSACPFGDALRCASSLTPRPLPSLVAGIFPLAFPPLSQFCLCVCGGHTPLILRYS